MCFYGVLNPDGTIPEPLIAEEDIPVWKIFEVINNNYLSWFKYEVYPLNELKEVKNFGIHYTNDYFYFEISEGLHAYDFATAIFEYEMLSKRRYKMCKCIIPKGTKYYYRNGEYVALAMKRVEN